MIEVEQLQCSRCAKPLPDGARFCRRCGCAVDQNVGWQFAPPAVPKSSARPQAGVPVPPLPRPLGKSEKKVAAAAARPIVPPVPAKTPARPAPSAKSSGGGGGFFWVLIVGGLIAYRAGVFNSNKTPALPRAITTLPAMPTWKPPTGLGNNSGISSESIRRLTVENSYLPSSPSINSTYRPELQLRPLIPTPPQITQPPLTPTEPVYKPYESRPNTMEYRYNPATGRYELISVRVNGSR